MKTKIWVITWFILVIIPLCIIGIWVYHVDPFFHYHKPLLESYYYNLGDERSQNDGIIQQFDYDAIITGTSMTENFRTTEAHDLFGYDFIKVAFAGGSYKEINDIVVKAISVNPDIKCVIRCLDVGSIIQDPDKMRFDMGEYPTHLYDDNPFNDVKYLLNRDVVFDLVYPMISENDQDDFKPGILPFDDYYRWQDRYPDGINAVAPDGFESVEYNSDNHLSDEQRKTIQDNFSQNVTSIAAGNPNIDFYFYFSPYGMAWWYDRMKENSALTTIESMEYATELMLPYDNIHLFAFDQRRDIIVDFNNYKDTTHYASWINDLMLMWMHEGRFRLTKENYKEFFESEYEFYSNFDYTSLNGQMDYEADYYAAALLNEELTGAEPIDVLNDDPVEKDIEGASYIYDESDNRYIGIDCRGCLDREPESDYLAYHLKDQEIIGIRFKINLDEGYNYLSFYGQKIADEGRIAAYVFNEDNEIVGKIDTDYMYLDNDKHQYVMDLSTVDGEVTVCLHGGYINYNGGDEAEYQFSEVWMY